MTAAASTSLYNNYKKFIRSRASFWKPKVEANLKQMIKNALNEASIEAAIKNLDHNMLQPSGLAITLQKIYVDAAVIWGGKIKQGVKKQAADLEKRAARQKVMKPIGTNTEMIAEVISYMRLHNLQMVTEITDTMKDHILQQLIEGQRTGLSLRAVAENIAASNFSANRAIVISRTETIKAANFGAMQAAKKSGFKVEKEWIAARDIRTRRIPRDEFSHMDMHGKTAELEEPFKVPNRNGSHDLLQQPGDPAGNPADVIQCRCTVGFNVIRGANGLPIATSGPVTVPTVTTITQPPQFVPPKPAAVPRAPKPPKPATQQPAAAPGFKPAATVLEAEDRIRATGVKQVSLKGMNISQANAVMKVMEKEAKAYDISGLTSISTYRSVKDGAKAFYSPGTKQIKLNLASIGQGYAPVKPYTEQLIEWKDMLEKWKSYLINPVYSNQKDKIRKNIKLYAAKVSQIEGWISKGYTSRFFSLSASYEDNIESITATVTHEMGHYRHLAQLKGTQNFTIELNKAITEYSEKDHFESFAEWYAHYRIKGKAGVPADLLKLFELLK
jgi:hypothetical protein